MLFRWWLVMRSRRAEKAAIFVAAITLLVGFVLLRRMAPVPPSPPTGAGPV
jgi:hypothetical protein